MQFSIPRLTAERLARLALVCLDDGTPIGHIGVRVTANAARFSATDGKLLVSVFVPLEKLDGTPGDFVLDRDQFTAAMKTTAKGAIGRIEVKIDEREARFTNGTSAIVSRVAGVYPQVGHVWTRVTGKRWVPSISSIDPARLSLAQKVSGSRMPLLFSSPVDADSGLEGLWGVTAIEQVQVAKLKPLLSAPSFWADHEMAILLMPITRGDAERQLDLSAHAMAAVVAEPAAAAAA